MASNFQKPIIVGHRGAAGHAPENTLPSFAKAIELGADMVEFDVRLCKSGELVVIHDKKIDRTTNGHGYVADKTVQELQLCDAGNGAKIPTLRQVLDFIDRRIKVNIELKGPDTAIAVSRLLQEYITQKGWQKGDFLVSFFNHDEVKRFKQEYPDILVGYIFKKKPLFGFDYDYFDVLIIRRDAINQSLVNNAHKHGKRVFVFTVNDFDTINKMLQLGVDGIISDYPDRVISAHNLTRD